MFTETPKHKFTFGADPEVFLRRSNEQERFFYSAEGIIPGSKMAPFKVRYGAIQVDGLAAEFNIDPVISEAGFLLRIRSVLGELKSRVFPNYKVYAVPVAYFDEKYYQSLPEHSKELGCNPDWNAYTGKLNPTPKAPPEIFRTGAGHIHIGWGKNFDTNDPNLLEACCHVVKHLDICIGKPLSSYELRRSCPEIEGYLSLDYKRRSLYGDFGCFRPTTYGVEYRSPSNLWLNSEKLVRWVFRQTQVAIDKAYDSTRFDYKVEYPQ